MRDFVTNRNPEFALNIELFEEHEEENLEGEVKEKFIKLQRQNWDEAEQWMVNYNAERKVIYDEEWQIYLSPVLQKI